MFLQGPEVLSQDGTLSIPEVSYDQAGHYMCVGAVPSVPGLTAEASVNLTIKGKGCQKWPPARWDSAETHRKSVTGGDTVIECAHVDSKSKEFPLIPSQQA